MPTVTAVAAKCMKRHGQFQTNIGVVLRVTGLQGNALETGQVRLSLTSNANAETETESDVNHHRLLSGSHNSITA